MPARVHHDDFGIGGKLVEDVGHRDHQRDRRDHHHQLRDDQAGDADEHQDGLALAGHQVDVAQRLGDPDSAVRLTSTSRNAPSVVRKIYRPIDPIRLRVPPPANPPARRTPRPAAPR